MIIGVGTYLINFWAIKVVGAAYLLYLSVNFFYHKLHGNRQKKIIRMPKKNAFFHFFGQWSFKLN
nr:hypothetical protein [Paucilactobacillus hokkaidonensis]